MQLHDRMMKAATESQAQAIMREEELKYQFADGVHDQTIIHQSVLV